MVRTDPFTPVDQPHRQADIQARFRLNPSNQEQCLFTAGCAPDLNGPFGAQGLDTFQLNAQDLAVEKEQGVERLILRAG